MDWTEILINIPVTDLEKAEEIAHMTVPYGFYTEDYSTLMQEVLEIAHIDLIDEELLEKDPQKAVIHIYISAEDNPLEAIQYLNEHLSACNIEFSIETMSIKEQDWANNWKQYFKPLEIGKKLAIVPSWEEYDNKDNRLILNLDPSSAFGTGTHETTKLCLEVLENTVYKGSKVLDVGCGSGILSVASGLLGAGSVTGVDIDPLAVKVAISNGLINNMDKPFFNMMSGNLTENILKNEKFDIIAANIVADVIIILLDSIKNHMTSESVIILSGIIDIRQDEVINELKNKGFKVTNRYEEKNWVCLTAKIV